MDIALMATGMKQVQLQQAVSISVLKMAMQNAGQSGEDFARLVESSSRMLENSAQPHLGKNLDTYA